MQGDLLAISGMDELLAGIYYNYYDIVYNVIHYGTGAHTHTHMPSS